MVAIAHLLASKTAAKCPDGVPIAFWVPLHHGEFVMPDVISALSPGTERRPIIDLAGGVDEVFGTVVPLEEIPFSAVRSVRGADFVTL